MTMLNLNLIHFESPQSLVYVQPNRCGVSALPHFYTPAQNYGNLNATHYPSQSNLDDSNRWRGSVRGKVNCQVCGKTFHIALLCYHQLSTSYNTHTIVPQCYPWPISEGGPQMNRNSFTAVTLSMVHHLL